MHQELDQRGRDDLTGGEQCDAVHLSARRRFDDVFDALGLDRAYVTSLAGILPATRFAVDAYVRFVREKTLLEAIASSLTEMFSPQIITERMEGMLANYAFITRETLAYFEKRPPQAARDADFALDYVKRNAHTPEQQQQVLAALEFKCSVLWAMCDALQSATRSIERCDGGVQHPAGPLRDSLGGTIERK